MQKMRMLAAALLVFVSLCPHTRGIAQKKGLDTAVTSRIQDVNTSTLMGYRLESDSSGAYYNGVDSVQSVLQASSGDWVLNTGSSPTRKVFVDFRDPVPGSGPNGDAPTPPFQYQQIPARMIAKAHDTSTTSFAGMTGLGSTLLS